MGGDKLIGYAKAGVRAIGRQHHTADAGKLLRMVRGFWMRTGRIAPVCKRGKKPALHKLISFKADTCASYERKKHEATAPGLAAVKQPPLTFRRVATKTARLTRGDVSFARLAQHSEFTYPFQKSYPTHRFFKPSRVLHASARVESRLKGSGGSVHVRLEGLSGRPYVRLKELSGKPHVTTQQARLARLDVAQGVRTQLSTSVKSQSFPGRLASSGAEASAHSSGPKKTLSQASRLIVKTVPLAGWTRSFVGVGKAISRSLAPVRAASDRPGEDSMIRPTLDRLEPAKPALAMKHSGNGPAFRSDMDLDKAQFGRWFDEFLTADARRPPSGVGGFDSRTAPIWPGRKPAF